MMISALSTRAIQSYLLRINPSELEDIILRYLKWINTVVPSPNQDEEAYLKFVKEYAVGGDPPQLTESKQLSMEMTITNLHTALKLKENEVESWKAKVKQLEE
jgi:hypothetical protein